MLPKTVNIEADYKKITVSGSIKMLLSMLPEMVKLNTMFCHKS